jgi:hypothetical protein
MGRAGLLLAQNCPDHLGSGLPRDRFALLDFSLKPET